jgi:hypothetical protein
MDAVLATFINKKPKKMDFFQKKIKNAYYCLNIKIGLIGGFMRKSQTDAYIVLSAASKVERSGENLTG